MTIEKLGRRSESTCRINDLLFFFSFFLEPLVFCEAGRQCDVGLEVGLCPGLCYDEWEWNYFQDEEVQVKTLSAKKKKSFEVCKVY